MAMRERRDVGQERSLLFRSWLFWLWQTWPAHLPNVFNQERCVVRGVAEIDAALARATANPTAVARSCQMILTNILRRRGSSLALLRSTKNGATSRSSGPATASYERDTLLLPSKKCPPANGAVTPFVIPSIGN